MNVYAVITLPGDFSAIAQKRQAYESTLKIGLQRSAQPRDITHGRLSLDGSQYIIEGNFSTNELKTGSMAKFLAPIVGLSAVAMGEKLNIQVFEGTWDESHKKVLQFLSDNKADWESDDHAGEISSGDISADRS